MKMKIIITLLIFSVGQVFAQTATITFHTKEDISVSIYRPIDDAFNNYIVSDKLELKPNISIDYKLDICGLNFIECKYSNGSRYMLILQGNESLTLDYSKDGITITGKNSEGMSYFNNNFFIPGFLKYGIEIDSIFSQNLYKEIDLKSINRQIQHLLSGFSRDIQRLKSEKKVTSEFCHALDNDIHFAIYNEFIRNLRGLLFQKEIKLKSEDIREINNLIETIYRDYPPMNEDILRYSFGPNYVSGYYNNLYGKLDKVEKEKLVAGYGENAFGPYVPFLLAPDSIQLPYLGGAYIIQLQYMVNEFDQDKMFRYLTNKYPQSQYVAIIKKRRDEKRLESTNNKNDSIIVVVDQINSLKELSKVEGIKNNYIFIDLWATWCNPCKTEFQYNEELHDLLNKYDGLVPVYLSIDEDRFEKLWRKNIDEFHLTGYNLRISKYLSTDIQRQIYKGGTFIIPRYILLDQNGEILDDDLPRPSSISKLKERLDDKIMK